MAEISLEGGRTLQASLVIGADGPRSPTRGMAGLRASGYSYEQAGMQNATALLLPCSADRLAS